MVHTFSNALFQPFEGSSAALGCPTQVGREGVLQQNAYPLREGHQNREGGRTGCITRADNANSVSSLGERKLPR